MSASKFLVDNEDNPGKIYLPFNAHFFLMVNSNSVISKLFNISYLKEDNIEYDNNKLFYSTSKCDDYKSLNKCLDEEKRHITTTKQEILNHDIGFIMTKDKCLELLSDLGPIDKIRFIVLSNKRNIIQNIKQSNPYSYILTSMLINKNIGLKSCVLQYNE